MEGGGVLALPPAPGMTHFHLISGQFDNMGGRQSHGSRGGCEGLVGKGGVACTPAAGYKTEILQQLQH